MANYMAEVAKTLGVELGEEFEIQTTKQGCITGIITAEDIYVPRSSEVLAEYNKSIILRNLLLGKFTVRRMHWKPKCGEIFFVVNKDKSISPGMWDGSTSTIMYYKLGNCYRTKEEAEANRDKWISFYASDEILEV